MVYAAIHKFEGQISVLSFEDGPSYRDIFPDELAAEAIPNCVEVGVWSVLPGMLGLYQANEALKICSGIGEVLSGQLLTLNLANMSSFITKITKLEMKL